MNEKPMIPEKVWDAVLEMVKQVPALVLMVIVVVVGINHLDKRDAAFKEMHQENLEARALSRQALRDTQVSMDRNTEVIAKLASAVDRQKR